MRVTRNDECLNVLSYLKLRVLDTGNEKEAVSHFCHSVAHEAHVIDDKRQFDFLNFIDLEGDRVDVDTIELTTLALDLYI